MAELLRYVVDASVVAKWFLDVEPRENFFDEAEIVRRDYTNSLISIIAPDILRHEIPSFLTKAVGSGRLPTHQALRLIKIFPRVLAGVRMIRSASLASAAHNASVIYRCTYYDGLYVALAERLGISLIHADGKLRRSLNGQFPLELWIEQYQSPE